MELLDARLLTDEPEGLDRRVKRKEIRRQKWIKTRV
jgi:hypothetical protein